MAWSVEAKQKYEKFVHTSISKQLEAGIQTNQCISSLLLWVCSNLDHQTVVALPVSPWIRDIVSMWHKVMFYYWAWR